MIALRIVQRCDGTDSHSKYGGCAAKTIKISVFVTANLVHEMVDPVYKEAEETFSIVKVDNTSRDEVIDGMISCKVWCRLPLFVRVVCSKCS
jgi:hypothetical protein